MSFPATLPPDFISPQHIVVASDLIDIGMLLPHVVTQAKASHAAVTLVHGVRTSVLSPLPEETDAIAVEDDYSKQLLSEMKRSIELEGIPCSIVVKNGLPGEIVRREIERVGAGRLIIGAHSYRPCGPIMIGAVANALLTFAPVPICVIGPMMAASSLHTSPRRILHPVSFSGLSQKRAHFAAEVARAYGAELTFLHVMASSVTASPYADDLETKTRRLLETFAEPSGLPVRIVMKYGEPLEEILGLAESEDSDLIVMGMRHKYPWWSTGNNIAYQVIAESFCPVLTIRDCILAKVEEGSNLAAQSSTGSS